MRLFGLLELLRGAPRKDEPRTIERAPAQGAITNAAPVAEMPINFRSHEWYAIARLAERELGRARVKNDADMTPEETAALRGEIRVWKRILAMPQQAESPEVESARYE